MKKVILNLLLLLPFSTWAENLDITQIRTEIYKADNVYKEFGMAGLKGATEECYSDNFSIACIYFDMTAKYIDAASAATFNFPPNEYFADIALLDRVSNALKSNESATIQYLNKIMPLVAEEHENFNNGLLSDLNPKVEENEPDEVPEQAHKLSNQDEVSGMLIYHYIAKQCGYDDSLFNLAHSKSSLSSEEFDDANDLAYRNALALMNEGFSYSHCPQILEIVHELKITLRNG